VGLGMTQIDFPGTPTVAATPQMCTSQEGFAAKEIMLVPRTWILQIILSSPLLFSPEWSWLRLAITWQFTSTIFALRLR
jgi:hypothetical protein